MKKLLALAALVSFACSQEPAPTKDLPVSPLEATKPPPPKPVAKAPSTPKAPPAPVAQPSLATCMKFPAGVTVIDSEEGIKKLAREEGPMAAGCPAELPPSGINWGSLSLVLAYTTATCNGEISESPEGFAWSEWGDCERAQVLKSSKLIAKDKAKGQKLVKVEKL
jgi:hypothetical protein